MYSLKLPATLSHSPNLPYSKGIGSPAAAIPVLKVVQREKLSRGKLKCTAGAPFKTSMTEHFYRGTADQNWFNVVVFKRSSGCTLQFPSAELFPLHNFQNWDCRCMRAYSFGVGEVWWMHSLPHQGEREYYGAKEHSILGNVLGIQKTFFLRA